MNNKDDVKCFAAVATSLNNYYPHADRSKNLYNIVIKGMKNTRAPQQKVVELPTEAVSETGIIDINLRDMKGNMHKLSDLKGKAVIWISQSIRVRFLLHIIICCVIYTTSMPVRAWRFTRFLWMLMSTIGNNSR